MAIHKLFSPAAFSAAIRNRLLTCTRHLLYSFAQHDSHSMQVFFSPQNVLQRLFGMLKVKSANSSVHSQGMPGNIHQTVLFKDVAVSLCVLSPPVYHITIVYLIRLANNIFTYHPRELIFRYTLLIMPIVPCKIISFCSRTVKIIYSNWCVQ